MVATKSARWSVVASSVKVMLQMWVNTVCFSLLIGAASEP